MKSLRRHVVFLQRPPAQREFMYQWLRKMRNSKTGKPLFVMDFQNDAEYVGGCIAGGRNYFHINSAGDIEPCVFIHYSDTNIRTHTLKEALKSPLFMQSSSTRKNLHSKTAMHNPVGAIHESPEDG